MKTLKAAGLIAAGAFMLTATAASAEIVCNDEGDCWHVKTRHEYKPEFKVRIYPDNWKWEEAEGKKYRWREHEDDDRGYWNKGIWLKF